MNGELDADEVKVFVEKTGTTEEVIAPLGV